MKKRILASLVCLCLLLGLLPTSALALKISVDDTEAEYSLAPLEDTKYMPVRGEEQTLMAGDAIGLRHITSLDELCAAFADPASDQTLSTYYDKRGADKKCVFSNTSSLALALGTAMGVLTKDTHNVTKQFVVENRSAQIGTFNVFKTTTLNFQNGISVKNGDLLFQNCWKSNGINPDTANQRINVVLGAPIEVKDRGRLILDGAHNHAHLPTEHSTLTAPAGESAIIVEKGGTVDAVYFEVARGESDTDSAPLIDVQSGGTLNFDTDNIYLNAAPVLDNGASGTPAVSVADGTAVTVNAGDFTASGEGAIFELAGGGKLTLEGGTITNSAGQPAITVDSGATVVIPKDSKASITSTGDKAIDLADGSKIEKGETAITVGTNTDDDGTNDNYVDNAGNIILAPGAEKGDGEMNAAVVLPDGTIVEGSETEAPTVETDDTGKTTVTIPAGGSVTDSNGTTTQLPSGGSATSDENGTTVEKTEVNVTGITLNQSSVTLYSNATPNTVQLTATVQPDDATDKTVTWTSSDPAVAAVDNNGLVTALSNGTATITASAGDKTATCAVTVTTYTTGGDSYEPSTPVGDYLVSVDKTTGGKVTVNPGRADKGDTVTITVRPDKGYELDSLTVTAKNGDTVKLTEKSGNKFTFKMPDSKVTVEAIFVKENSEQPVVTLPFADVNKGDWFYDAVEYVYGNDLMNGTSATAFSPYLTTSRAMMLTMLARYDGVDTTTGSTWYEAGAVWAVSEGISDGTNLEADLTREQLVTMLWRYAGSPVVESDLSAYPDGASVSDWAVNAMIWATQTGVITGNGAGALAPQGTATRAEVATILARFCAGK